MNQGALANKAGASLESIIQKLLIKYKIGYTSQSIFTGIYGGKNKMDFIFKLNDKIYAMEVKNQNVAGSVDEKIPYCMLNGASIETDGFILILEGSHFEKKTGIKKWALNFISKYEKEMHVFNVNDFEEWLISEQNRNDN